MSADNEIAILEMRKEGKYYVAMIQGCPSSQEVELESDPSGYQKEIIEHAKRDERVFDTYEEASNNATAYEREIYNEGMPLEYGVTFYSVPYVPSEEKKSGCECLRCRNVEE